MRPTGTGPASTATETSTFVRLNESSASLSWTQRTSELSAPEGIRTPHLLILSERPRGFARIRYLPVLQSVSVIGVRSRPASSGLICGHFDQVSGHRKLRGTPTAVSHPTVPAQPGNRHPYTVTFQPNTRLGDRTTVAGPRELVHEICTRVVGPPS
jgi:hypothetical protein